MNLTELYEIQGGLDYHIRDRKGLQDEDLMKEKVLALYVELGELANEWRRFKFWSEDQTPRRQKMLEEYADCFSFILSLGLEGVIPMEASETGAFEAETITQQFNALFRQLSAFDDLKSKRNYIILFDLFRGLGKMLCFTEEEIETAYKTKNLENHLRQRNGY
ncbi:dUTP diphosphatase [Salimicrobium halophilum]|uniref:Dimeric dUTPase, all-alpha-NTP-PPase (MazG) superfamily n=1 Tax=Salimicrobium halophilum TaxID=86666 RepID=A0A1G8WET1_9BACI|nr:dUTP diphosphatase [Salimicrobium halophilum]SDJ76792.1 Dimeric dUTPase, all-alpha-NTP-PPase (MazG) superfamily [Salimicrobium halophilum]